MIYKKNKKQYTDNKFKEIQSLLGVKSDGYFGKNTDAAVRKFQASKGLVVDGIIGKNTLGALYPDKSNSNNRLIKGDNISMSNITNTKPIGEDFDANRLTQEFKASKESFNQNNINTYNEAGNGSNLSNISNNNVNNNNFNSLQEKDREVERARKEVSDIEAKLANLSSKKDSTMEDFTFDITKDLIQARDNLRRIQDDAVSYKLTQNEKLRGEGGTKSDYQHMTGQALRDYAVESGIESRKYARLSEGLSAIKEQINSEYENQKEVLMFTHKVKSDRLRTIQNRYWHQMDKAEQRQWETTKELISAQRQNDLLGLKNDIDLRKELVGLGYQGSDVTKMSMSDVYTNIGKLRQSQIFNEKLKNIEGITFDTDGNPIFPDIAGKEKAILYKQIAKATEQSEYVNKVMEESTMEGVDTLDIYKAMSEVGYFNAATNDGADIALFNGNELGIARKMLGVIKQTSSEETLTEYQELRKTSGAIGAMSNAEWTMFASAANAINSSLVYDEESGTRVTAIKLSPEAIKTHMETINNHKIKVNMILLNEAINPNASMEEKIQFEKSLRTGTPEEVANMREKYRIMKKAFDNNQINTNKINNTQNSKDINIENPVVKYKNKPTGQIPQSEVISWNRKNEIPENYIRGITFKNPLANKFIDGLMKNESLGNGGYKAIGLTPVTRGMYAGQRALGIAQVMEGNLPIWGKEAGFKYEITPEIFLNNPKIQDYIINHQFEKSMKKYGNVKDAVSVWFSGKPYNVAKNRKDGNGTSVAQYVDKFIRNTNLG